MNDISTPYFYSIKEIRNLSERIASECFRIYIVVADDCVLYVGRSQNALERMLSHMAIGTWAGLWCGTSLQIAISNLYPESDNWTVAFLTEAQCIQNGHTVDSMESFLVYKLSPVFNVQGLKEHRHNAERWYTIYPPGIANAGVQL